MTKSSGAWHKMIRKRGQEHAAALAHTINLLNELGDFDDHLYAAKKKMVLQGFHRVANTHNLHQLNMPTLLALKDVLDGLQYTARAAFEEGRNSIK